MASPSSEQVVFICKFVGLATTLILGLLNLMITLLLLNVFMVIYFDFALVLAYYRVKIEEDLLSSEEGFGEEYRHYMKRTGKFFPKLQSS